MNKTGKALSSYPYWCEVKWRVTNVICRRPARWVHSTGFMLCDDCNELSKQKLVDLKPPRGQFGMMHQMNWFNHFREEVARNFEANKSKKITEPQLIDTSRYGIDPKTGEVKNIDGRIYF